MVDDSQPITPQLLLRAYAAGIFPMAESADDPGLFWLEPKQRGVLPLDGFCVPRRLARTVRADLFTVMVDRDFDAVIEGCAASADDRPTTWINARIRSLYGDLFHMGHCHTVEVRDGAGTLVGGLYGVRLGGAFFGESMFHTARDASKVALVHLVARLKAGGFTLLDTQFVTPHLAQFGAIELGRSVYRRKLEAALGLPARWDALPADVPVSGARALEIIAMT
jgi:leucyl/phenylalanyl-tRNA--protein transferase